MWLTRLIAAISPRSDDYFRLFNELADCSVRGAKLLAQMSSVRDPAAFQALFDEIKKTEGVADQVTGKILMAMHQTFITPFDRWEIKDLAMALDDMVDYMEDIPQRAALYGPGEFTPEMSALGQIMLRATEKVKEAVALLSDMDNAQRILQICQDIGEIESEADRLILDLYRDTYRNENDPIRFLLRKDLFEILEKAIDRCRDAGNVVYAIALKNS